MQLKKTQFQLKGKFIPCIGIIMKVWCVNLLKRWGNLSAAKIYGKSLWDHFRNHCIQWYSHRLQPSIIRDEERKVECPYTSDGPRARMDDMLLSSQSHNNVLVSWIVSALLAGRNFPTDETKLEKTLGMKICGISCFCNIFHLVCVCVCCLPEWISPHKENLHHTTPHRNTYRQRRRGNCSKSQPSEENIEAGQGRARKGTTSTSK